MKLSFCWIAGSVHVFMFTQCEIRDTPHNLQIVLINYCGIRLHVSAIEDQLQAYVQELA
jgi:hypothetical protein